MTESILTSPTVPVNTSYKKAIWEFICCSQKTKASNLSPADKPILLKLIVIEVISLYDSTVLLYEAREISLFLSAKSHKVIPLADSSPSFPIKTIYLTLS